MTYKNKENSIVNEHWIKATVCLFLVVGAFLRLYNLGRESFWIDEIDQIMTAALPLGKMSQALSWHVSPPLDYFILHFVLALGQDETLVRLPAALFGIATIYVLYRAGEALDSVEIGIGTAALFTFSLAAIAYAQEARMYSLFIFLTSLLLWRCALLIQEPTSWARWLSCTLVALLLIYTHYYGALVLFGLGLFWLALSFWPRWHRTLFVRGTLSFSLVGGIFALWLPIVLQQSARRAGALSYALAREDYWETMLRYLSGGLSLPFALLYFMLFIVGLLYSLRLKPLVAGFLIAFTVMPLLLAYIVPALSRTVTPRNMLCALPGYLVGIAIGFRLVVWQAARGFSRLTKRRLPAAATLFWLTIISISVMAFYASSSMLSRYYDRFWWMKGERAPWRDRADFLKQNMGPHDIVLVNNTRSRYLLSFYLDPLAIKGQTFIDFSYNPKNNVTGVSRDVPVLTLEAPLETLRKNISVAENSWLLGSDLVALQEIGLNTALFEPIEDGAMLPLYRFSTTALTESPIIDLNDTGDIFSEGWLPQVYSVEKEAVRWMSTASRLRLQLWSAEHDSLFLSFFAPADLSGAKLFVSFDGAEATPLSVSDGWQSVTIPIPKELRGKEEPLMVELEVRELPKPPESYAIGTTGATVAVPIVVESSGKEGDTFARLYINGTLYDWHKAGKGHGRGVNLLALEPTSGEVLDWQVFDTHRDETANSAMLTWVEGLAEGTIVAGAVKDEGSALLNETGVAALELLGSAIDLRGYYRKGHAFIGVKGAERGSIVEGAFNDQELVLLGSDRQHFVLAVSKISLQASESTSESE